MKFLPSVWVICSSAALIWWICFFVICNLSLNCVSCPAGHLWGRNSSSYFCPNKCDTPTCIGHSEQILVGSLIFCLQFKGCFLSVLYAIWSILHPQQNYLCYLAVQCSELPPYWAPVLLLGTLTTPLSLPPLSLSLFFPPRVGLR